MYKTWSKKKVIKRGKEKKNIKKYKSWKILDRKKTDKTWEKKTKYEENNNKKYKTLEKNLGQNLKKK